MKKLFIVITVLFSAFAAQSQVAPPQNNVQLQKKVIRWGSNDLPEKCCVNYMNKNRLVTFYEDDKIGFLLTVDLTTEKKYVILYAAFLNKSGTPFTIEPEKFWMRMTEPRNVTYNRIPAEDVAKKMENRGRWRMALAAGLAGMSTTQSTATVTDNRGNRADVTVTEQNQQAQRNVQNASREQSAANRSKADAVRELSLPIHTLFKDKIVDGYVFFKQEKLANGMIISFEIDGVIYEIPYGADRKKQSQQNRISN